MILAVAAWMLLGQASGDLYPTQELKPRMRTPPGKGEIGEALDAPRQLADTPAEEENDRERSTVPGGVQTRVQVSRDVTAIAVLLSRDVPLKTDLTKNREAADPSPNQKDDVQAQSETGRTRQVAVSQIPTAIESIAPDEGRKSGFSDHRERTRSRKVLDRVSELTTGYQYDRALRILGKAVRSVQSQAVRRELQHRADVTRRERGVMRKTIAMINLKPVTYGRVKRREKGEFSQANADGYSIRVVDRLVGTVTYRRHWNKLPPDVLCRLAEMASGDETEDLVNLALFCVRQGDNAQAGHALSRLREPHGAGIETLLRRFSDRLASAMKARDTARVRALLDKAEWDISQGFTADAAVVLKRVSSEFRATSIFAEHTARFQRLLGTVIGQASADASGSVVLNATPAHKPAASDGVNLGPIGRDGWSSRGGDWKWDKGSLVTTRPGSLHYKGSSTSLELEIVGKLDTAARMRIYFRWRDGGKKKGRGYCVKLTRTRISLQIRGAGGGRRDDQGFRTWIHKEFPGTQLTRIRIRAVGDTLEVWGGNVLLARRKDQRFESGEVRIVVQEGGATFKSIKIRAQ